MKKDLPNVFANAITKKFVNSQEIFTTSENKKDNIRSVTKVPVETIIKRIFNSPTHVYKTKVLITTDAGESIEEIIGKINGFLLTMSGKKIRIHEIINIEEITN